MSAITAEAESSTSADHPLVFLHVPKTAGTTLWLILRRQYSPDAVLRVDSDAEFAAVTDQQWRDIRVLTGHTPFGAHHFPLQPTYVTILRDPLERILSQYCHMVRDTDPSLLLDGYLDAQMPETDNGQTRMLAGPDAGSVPFGQCDRAVFEAAKCNLLENTAVAGLTERFDETLMLLQRRLGWTTPCYVRENVGANRIGREDVPRDLLKRIWDLNRWDRELYALASARMEGQIAQEGPAFAEALRRFRIANVQYRRMKALVAAGPLQFLKSRLALGSQMGLERVVRTILGVTPSDAGAPEKGARRKTY